MTVFSREPGSLNSSYVFNSRKIISWNMLLGVQPMRNQVSEILIFSLIDLVAKRWLFFFKQKKSRFKNVSFFCSNQLIYKNMIWASWWYVIKFHNLCLSRGSVGNKKWLVCKKQNVSRIPLTIYAATMSSLGVWFAWAVLLVSNNVLQI